MVKLSASNFLKDVLKEIVSLLGAESGSLLLLDFDNKELVLDGFISFGGFQDIQYRSKLGEGISGKVADSKEPVLVRDIRRDPRFKRNGYNHYNTNSFISIPLFSRDGFIGLINVTDKSNHKPFTEQDLQFAVSLCKFASVIMSKSEQYNEKYSTVAKLASGVVHEVNNPLDGIIRYTNILLNQVKSNPEARENLIEIKKGLSRISSTTRSFLDFARSVNSVTSEIRNYSNICDVINEALNATTIKSQPNITVIKDFNEDFGRVLDHGLVYVFLNIIKNAIDAMPNGGKLEISVKSDDPVLKVMIKDTGVGITTEIKNRMFEPFFTTKSIDKGTGLGLAISNEIMRKYSSKIDCDSTVGKGTCFTISIPKKYCEK